MRSPADDLEIYDGEFARSQRYGVPRDVDADAVVVDLRAGATGEALSAWIDRPHLSHWIGSLFPAVTLDNRVAAVRPAEE